MPTYEILPDRSSVSIDASSSIHPIRGSATGVTGLVEVDSDGALAGGRIELPVDALSSGNPLEDGEMRRRVDARRYPTIVGEAVHAAPADVEGRYRVSGKLTFHGVTRDVEDEVTVALDDDGLLHVEGNHSFDVRDFGVKPPRIGFLRVHPDVRVALNLIGRSRG
jgi:polyisoprenoid-binding protein YceI